MKHSVEIVIFAAALSIWINGGCEPHKVFNKSTAMCMSLNRFLRDTLKIHTMERNNILWEFKHILNKKYGEFMYPFNIGDSYRVESIMSTVYENPKRLAFIKELLK